jgi:hypothetical protein
MVGLLINALTRVREASVARSVLAGPPSGHSWKSYYSAGGRLVALREEVSGGSNTLYFLHSDHLGSASLTTNSTNGTVLSRQTYYPFGKIRSTSGLHRNDSTPVA